MMTGISFAARTRMKTTRAGLVLPKPLQHRLEAAALELLQPKGQPRVDFAHPLGEPALTPPDSVSWQVFKNPVAIFIGGMAAVILELAEPRVRTGVWEHSSFREHPMARLQRTGLATMMTVYGPCSQTQRMIAAVVRMHRRVSGITPDGQAYCACDPELLDWVHATASFGFLEAYSAYVRPLGDDERNRFYAEGIPSARAYGATGAPRSQAELVALFDSMRERLEPSGIVAEFLQIMRDAPVLARPLRPVQTLLIKAAVQITPAWVRERLGLDRRWILRPWQRRLVRKIGETADRLLLRSSPAVQSCRRLGLPDDFLYAPHQVQGF